MTDIEIQYTIYKIVAKDPNIQECYVGSTLDFVRRKRQHKSNTTNEKRDGYNWPVYKFIRENGGWKNWDMIELEIIECTQIESLKLERKYMDELEPTLNSYKSFITDEEKVEYKKQYDIDNKEKRKEQYKQRYIANKEALQAYYIDNRESILEKRNEKFECKCGGRFARGDRARHFKSKKHKNYLLSKCAE